MIKKLKLALVQLSVGLIKQDNLSNAALQVKKAASNGAHIVCLPECFNSPYGKDYFKEYAESIPGESTEFLSALAKENDIYLVGGSIPEKDGAHIYNTCTVWNPNGKMLAKHRKVHLFDINIPGGITFQESAVLSAGKSMTNFETPFCKIGIGICYDMRFAEMAQLYAREGCKLLIYPGAFNTTTGPLHWELLQRARAVDNQLFVATVSPARSKEASYPTWGHSSVVDPYGKVVATTDHEETIVYAEIDLDYVDKVREMIPVTKQRRDDLYDVILKPS